MKKILMMAPVLFAASACTVPEAAVSSYNGDSVTLQISEAIQYQPEDVKTAKKAEMLAEAERICRKGHKKKAEFVSQRYVQSGPYSAYYERLYLCLN